MNYLTTCICLAALFTLSTISNGQSDGNYSGLMIGFNLSQVQGDFGVGLHAISPKLFQSQLAVKLAANLHWLDQSSDEGSSWKPYSSIQFGMRTGHQMQGANIYLYTEGGLAAVLPNNSFSSNHLIVGGYGLIGCTFSPNSLVDYFFEAGSMGSGARAELLSERVSYAHGFVMSVGLRFRI